MRQSLYRRLKELEAADAQVRIQLESPHQEAVQEAARNKIRLFLKMRGVEQDPRESLMDAWSRALEMRSQEIREMLKKGMCPIRKYFTDHGVHEEIERRKAAGTWPSGSTVEGQNVRL